MQQQPEPVSIAAALASARGPYLRYFHALLERGVPLDASGEVHAQRLLVLYLCVVGSDLLRDDWLPAHRQSNGNRNRDIHKQEQDEAPSDLATAITLELERCYDSASGGFHPCDPSRHLSAATLPMTHCGLVTLLVCGTLAHAARAWLDVELTVQFITSCQLSHGGNGGGFTIAPDIPEADLRPSYSAFVSYAVLLAVCAREGLAIHSIVRERIASSVRAGLAYVWGCWRPFEGGFAANPDTAAECHGGMTFCATASLSIGRALVSEPPIPHPVLARLRRYVVCRVASGSKDDDPSLASTVGPYRAVGFQGRPTKPSDTCYTHWLGCTLALVQRGENLAESEKGEVNAELAAQFCVMCLDTEADGDTPALGVMARSTDIEPDVVHAALGLSGVLTVLRHGGRGAAYKNTWDGMCPPHPVYGCSEATAAASGLPDAGALCL